MRDVIECISDHEGQGGMSIPSHGIFDFLLKIQMHKAMEVGGVPEEKSLPDVGRLEQGLRYERGILKSAEVQA